MCWAASAHMQLASYGAPDVTVCCHSPETRVPVELPADCHIARGEALGSGNVQQKQEADGL